MRDIRTRVEFTTFDQLLRQRAVDEDQTPLLAFPKTKYGVNDYEFIKGRELNRFVDAAAYAFIAIGIKPVIEETVVGIYAPSDLDYIINIFGLGRLGYTTFLLSSRLPAPAVSTLLTNTRADTLLYHPQYEPLVLKTQELQALAQASLKIIPIISRETYDNPTKDTPPYTRPNIDHDAEPSRRYVMLHSSGSTGLPKPLHFTNKRMMVAFLSSQPRTSFQSVPVSHAHGFITYIQAIYQRKTMYCFNSHIPQTHDTLTAAIAAAKPEVVWTVPYVLKLLAEKQDGIDVLKDCFLVSSSGSKCPDDLGDLLVSNGVFLGLTFGSTEVAGTLSSLNRPRDDKAWNYLRPYPHTAPYLLFRLIDGGPTSELIVMDGHKSKAVNNSMDPPNSFHTSDIFLPHDTIPNAWKFMGRLDDRVTLLNGEKVLPLPIEGSIRAHPLVKEAVIFGIDRPVPGLLLFRADLPEAEGLSDDKYLEEVWSIIQDANTRAEGFSQIIREMIEIIPSNVECATTDKSSIKRGQIYQEFEDLIDKIYVRLESSQEGSLELEVPEIEKWIVETFGQLNIFIPDTEADFFAAGVDSLKAIQMRGLIIRNLALGGNVARCTSLIVYDCGNAKKLAKKLYDIRTGGAEDDSETEINHMEQLIEKYSVFPEHIPGYAKLSEGHVVVLTGATGSLGSHVLSQLVTSSYVSKIYVVLRTSPTESATERLTSSLKSRSLSIPLEKVTALSSDMSIAGFAISSFMLAELTEATTHIIHCAWAVNFALPVSSFTPQFKALHNLITLSLSSPHSKPARLLYCSSVGAAMGTPSPATIAESPIPSLKQAAPTGYSRSKLIGERICEAARSHAGARVSILRIGQIVPARNVGSQLWNPNEAIPLLVRSSTVTGCLPTVMGKSGADGAAWVECDVSAGAMLDIAGLSKEASDSEKQQETQLVFNLVHPRIFSWKEDFLPKLKAAGLDFETVQWGVWLQKLRASEIDIEKNPSRKLLGFWGGDEEVTDNQICGEEVRTANTNGTTVIEKEPLEITKNTSKGKDIRFETKGTETVCLELRNAPRVVDGDMVQKLLSAWKASW